MTTRKFKQTRSTNYFSIIAIVLLFGVLITSCKDEFEAEQLFISQQERSDQIAQQEADEKAAEQLAEEELSAENAAALAAAANLTYTITLTSDDLPVVDVDVMLTNQNGGSTAAVTTDTNGNAVFVDIDLGGYNVAITSDNYLNASYLVDFGSPQEGVHYEWVNGSIIALEQTEASRIELLELNGTQTATIQGNVEIETDLTNSTPEIPLDVTIRANLDSFNGMFEHTNNSFNGSNDTDSFYIAGSFSLTEGDIGSANVDPNTGDYSMLVPAQEDGTTIELLFPLIETDQTLAFSSVNGQDVGAQVGTQAAVFGPDITATTTPSIKGVTAEFTAPPEPGRGLDVTNFTRNASDINPLGGSFVSIDEFPVEDFLGIRFKGSRGSGYQHTPIVTVSAPDLSEGVLPANATIEAWMRWTFETITITNGGAGYNGNVPIFIRFLDTNDMQLDLVQVASVQAIGGSLPLTIVDNLSYMPDPYVTNFIVDDMEVVIGGFFGAGATAEVTRSGEVDVFRIRQDGRGYLEIPTIDVEAAPEGGTDATLEITDMAFQYMFDIHNTSVTQPYVILPEIDFEYESSPDGSTDITDEVRLVTIGDDGFVDQLSLNNHEIGSVILASDGQVQLDNDAFFGATDIDRARLVEFSYSTPRAIIVEPTHEQTTADLLVNSDGEITGLANISHGRGYNSNYTVMLTTLEGLPGSGAMVDLVDFDTDSRTDEVTWSGDYILTNGGSGYTLDVNITEEPFTPGTASQSITVKNGETKIINVNYGTGKPVAELE